jgi:hypothetical protein
VLISSHRKLLRSKAVVVFLFTKKNERQGASNVQTALSERTSWSTTPLSAV